MYKKEAAGLLAILSMFLADYEISQKSFPLLAFGLFIYWFVRFVATDYKKD